MAAAAAAGGPGAMGEARLGRRRGAAAVQTHDGRGLGRRICTAAAAAAAEAAAVAGAAA